MDEESLPKTYDPKCVEEKWYTFWEKEAFFQADALSKKSSYCISIPPPNVTGVLHMGHALVDTLQDVLIRWKRMCGFEALFVPGTDHAGIATQTVVERYLIKTTGKRRIEFSREEFLKHIEAWKEQSEKQIISQIKRLGCSCDWSRLAFTMDPARSRAVRTSFKKLFDAGLIYQGDYLVNWDPVTQTALADDEVEYEERDSHLWYFRYPIENSVEFITVATTRPETMLGDTAIAVSPSDTRYQMLIGKRAILPLMQRPIPIVADGLVDPAFGTGAVKITPAHDPNDYEISQRHSLPLINILTPDGKVNEQGGSFVGMSVLEARKAIVSAMQDLGLVAKIDPHRLRVGVSYRSKAVIEPYLSKQWFVKMQSFKPMLRSVVEEKRVRLIPESWQHTYFHWIDNLRDWCISRQLWWGHRIPIWYSLEDPKKMICYAGEGLPPEVAANPDAYRQDEDVLDTWFSSALWPFSILGWPEQTPDLKKFYPNSVLVTGHDILFFWVARMILMGCYNLGEVPFPEVFLHGLIYGKSYWRYNKDGSIAYLSAAECLPYDLGKQIPTDVHFKWEKMSKSKGNVIDPIEMIDTYGADALRMGLCASATQARQIDLDRRRFEEFKNFANKIWNGARFVFQNIEDLSPEEFAAGIDPRALSLEDRWILSLLSGTIRSVSTHLENYSFDKAAETSYTFFWKEFCAYFVELSKPVLFGKLGSTEMRKTKQKLLVIVLCAAVRLMHPMAPFITEELFSLLKAKYAVDPNQNADPYTKETLEALFAPACLVAPYPKVLREEDIDPDIERTFSFLGQIVHIIRNIRAEMQIPPGAVTDLIIQSQERHPERILVEKNQGIIQALVRTESIHYVETDPSLPFSASSLVSQLKIVVPLPKAFKEKELARLVKEKEKWILQQNQMRTKLSNEAFVTKAPPHLVDKLKTDLASAEASLADVMKKLAQLSC